MQSKLYNYKNQVFYLAYAIMIINATLIKNINSTMSKITMIIYLSLYFLNLILKRYTVKEFILIHIGFLISSIIFLKSKETDLLILTMLILSSSGVNFKKIVRIDFITRLTGVMSTILLFMIGITKDFIMYRDNGINNIIEVRHSLGFNHPNSLSVNVFILVLAYIFISYKKIKFSECIIIILIMNIFGEITGSRTGLICTFIVILMLLLDRCENFYKINITKFIFKYSVTICTATSFILIILYRYDLEFVDILNSVLTGRIKSASYFLDTYGISLLGQEVKLVSVIQSQQTSEQMRILDNLYASLGIRSGIIYLTIYNLLYIKLNKYLYMNNLRCESILITIMAIYGMIEKVPISPELNFTVLLLGIIIYKKSFERDLMINIKGESK